MRHEGLDRKRLAAVTAAAAEGAAEHDRDGSFPAEAIAGLERLGLVARPPVEPVAIGGLLRLLAAVGRGDLSVGRIYEGHVNAMFLIRLFATAEQVARYGALAAEGRVFGVWNTDAPGRPLTLADGVLQGAKSFSTGIDGLSHALVTLDRPEGRVMLMAPLDSVAVDRSWWRPLGMRASGSHLVDFSGLEVEDDWVLGAPGDYVGQPWFSGGAIRFAAVHVGGMHAVLDEAAAHLSRTGRDGDPFQAHRLGRMAIAVEAGYGWLDRAARAWEEAAAEDAPEGAAEALVATANAARLAVEANAMAVLDEAERSVGAAGMIAPHRLERLVRDLRTYLRQPNPDGALSQLGAAVAGGVFVPGER